MGNVVSMEQIFFGACFKYSSFQETKLMESEDSAHYESVLLTGQVSMKWRGFSVGLFFSGFLKASLW